MLQNCFKLPMLPTNAYFRSVCLVSMSLCYHICLEKEIQLLLGQPYMFRNVIIWYVQWQKTIEHTSLFIFDLAIVIYCLYQHSKMLIMVHI